MFYYLTVSYDISDLRLSESSRLSNPYPTSEARDRAIGENLGKRDLETSENVNVTKLKVCADGELISEDSFLASDEHQIESDDDETEV